MLKPVERWVLLVLLVLLMSTAKDTVFDVLGVPPSLPQKTRVLFAAHYDFRHTLFHLTNLRLRMRDYTCTTAALEGTAC